MKGWEITRQAIARLVIASLIVLGIACISSATGCGESGSFLGGDAGPLPDTDSGDSGAENDGGEDGDADTQPDELDAGPLPLPDPPSLEELCGAVPTTVDEWESCFLARRCDGVLLVSRPGFADVEDCVAFLDASEGGRRSALSRERARAVASERASIDEEAFARCLAFVRDLSTHEHFSDHCGARYTGTIPDGEACYADVECASPGATCARSSCDEACCEGVCEPLAKLGADCDDFYACEPGLACSLTNRKCVRGDVGSPCVDNFECDVEAWCDVSKGVCRADLPEDAPCSSILQCSGELTCVGLGIASDNDPRCRRVTQPGDACVDSCKGPLHCVGGAGATGTHGECVPLPTLGEPCSLFVSCASATEICDPGTDKCVARPGAGDGCLGGACGPGLFCSSAIDPGDPTCMERLAAGEGECTAPRHCASYQCSGEAGSPGECIAFEESCP